jgi:hypothetical protein
MVYIKNNCESEVWQLDNLKHIKNLALSLLYSLDEAIPIN